MSIRNHILVVGNHQLQAALYSDACSDETMVSVVSNLDDARCFIEHRKVDLVVADLQLPDGSGTELIKMDGDGELCQVLIMAEENFDVSRVDLTRVEEAGGEIMVKSEKILRDLPRTAESRAQNWNRTLARKQSSQHLQHLVAIWGANPDFVGTTDVDGFFLHLNSEGRRMMGLDDQEDVSHIRLVDIHDKEHATALVNAGFQEAVSEGVWRAESTLIPINGDPVPVSQVLIAHKDTLGDVTHFSTILHDLTAVKTSELERKRLAEDLNQVLKMESIGRLAGGIAHDLNNRLTAIIGYAELGLIEAMSDKACKDELEMVIQSCEQASDLIEQLVTFSRKQAINPKLQNVNEVVDNTTSMLVKVLGASFDVEVDLEPGLWPVIFDRSQLEQIVVNLVTNARDAMPSGGRIKLTTSNITLTPQKITTLGIAPSSREDRHNSPDSLRNRHLPAGMPGTDTDPARDRLRMLAMEANDFVVFSVSDSGSGIEEEMRPHIFEPFYSSSRNDLSGGMGLSSVYGAVVQNKGAIYVTESEFGGSRFDVYLRRG